MRAVADIAPRSFRRAQMVTDTNARERQITTALTAADYRRFDDRARARGITKAAYLRQIVLRELAGDDVHR